MTRTERERRIALLRAECQVLSNRRARLETINEREDAAPWIGQCFKYRNRSSDGQSWWMYLRILKHVSGNAFTAAKIDPQPDWLVCERRASTYLLPDPKERGLVPITRREFDAAVRRFAATVVAVASGRAPHVARTRPAPSRRRKGLTDASKPSQTARTGA